MRLLKCFANLIAALLLVAFGCLVWPTLWAVLPGPGGHPIRVHRLTGRMQALTATGWRNYKRRERPPPAAIPSGRFTVPDQVPPQAPQTGGAEPQLYLFEPTPAQERRAREKERESWEKDPEGSQLLLELAQDREDINREIYEGTPEGRNRRPDESWTDFAERWEEEHPPERGE